MRVYLRSKENDFFRDWIIKEWQHHNTVDPIYQLDIMDPREIQFAENEKYFQIIHRNTIVGFVGIKTYEHVLYVYRFYIEEEYRNNGIGTLALEQIIKMAAKEDKDLSLDVFGENIAKKLYERLGFKKRFTNMVLKITPNYKHYDK